MPSYNYSKNNLEKEYAAGDSVLRKELGLAPSVIVKDFLDFDGGTGKSNRKRIEESQSW